MNGHGASEGRAIQPIFVLGIQRSGTTWLANMLAAHPGIAAVAAERHQGVHESVFFSHFAKAYGPLALPGAWQRFACAFERSDYFRLTGIEREWFRGHAVSTDYATIFRLLMNEYARRRQAVAWLEKSPHHTLLADDLRRRFPDAKFVCITRRSETLVRSRLWSYGRTPPPNPARLLEIAKGCAANAFFTARLASFCAGNGHAMLVTFESLKRDPEQAMRRVSDFLGMGFDPVMLRPPYKPNSSFQDQVQVDAALARSDRMAIAVFARIASLLPPAALAALRSRIVDGASLEFPKWVWSEDQAGKEAGDCFSPAPVGHAPARDHGMSGGH